MKWLCCFICACGFGAEMIYGVMITGLSSFHEKMARRAVDSFFQQTYPEKHLIVVNDGDYSVAGWYPGRITELRLKNKMRLGALRNRSLEMVPEGAMWVQWDDDDWNHPRRVEEQYEAIRKKGSDGCLMAKLLYYVFEQNISLFNSSKKCPGTIMCRKRGEIRYPDDMAVAEDVEYRDRYMEKYSLFSWDNPRHYLLKLAHEKNVWAKGFGRKRRPNRWKGDDAAKAYLKDVLKENYLFVYDALGVGVPPQLR